MKVTEYKIGMIPIKKFEPAVDTSFAVLAVHGFGGSKNSRAIALLAEKLSPLGGAVIAVDLPSHGENRMGPENLMTEKSVGVVLEAAKHVCETYPGLPCGVFATSFGGYLALNAADSLAEIFGKGFPLVLRAPAVRMGESLRRVVSGESASPFDMKAPSFVKITGGIIPEEFVHDLIANAAVRPFDVCAIVLHGTEDTVVPRCDIEDFIALNPDVRLVSVDGADHRFSAEGTLDCAIDAAVQFFASQM